MERRFKAKGPKVLMIIVIALMAFSVFSFIVMSLWNAVLVPVLNISMVTFWQAAGILVLSKILFGGFKGGGPFRGKGPWGREMREKWQSMTPEEKEAMKQQWRSRCSSWGNMRQPSAFTPPFQEGKEQVD